MQSPIYEPRHVLFDNSTHAVLAIHSNLAAIVATSEMTPNSAYFPEFTRFVQPPRRQGRIGAFLRRAEATYRSKEGVKVRAENEFDFLRASLLEYPEWSWGSRPLVFSRVLPELVTPELRRTSALAQARCIIVHWLMVNISYARAKHFTGIHFQDLVYLEKKRQALALRDSNFDPSVAINAPYVTEYAAFTHVTLERAARDIILQAQLADDYLLKTELLRLTFFEKVRKARKPEDMKVIMDEFIKATSRDSLA